MNKYSFLVLVTITITILASSNVVTNAFSTSSASVSISYCPPICLDEVQQHVDDAKDAVNDGKVVEAASELDIVSSLLDQIDDMTSKSD